MLFIEQHYGMDGITKMKVSEYISKRVFELSIYSWLPEVVLYTSITLLTLMRILSAYLITLFINKENLCIS